MTRTLCYLLLGLLVAIPVAMASTNYVTPTGGGSFSGADWDNALSNVQDAVDLATNAGDIVYLKYGTYTNSVQVEITNAPSLTIEGGYAGNTAGGLPGELTNEVSVLTRATGANSRMLWVVGCTVSMVRLTIHDGYLESTLNDQSQYGAGLYASTAKLTVSNCVFSDCYIDAWNGNGRYAHRWGGGMAAFDCTLTVDGAVFSNNWVRVDGNIGNPQARAGGLYSSGGTTLVTNCRFAGNNVSHKSVTGTGRGGAIYIIGGSNHEITHCAIEGNTASTYGGGLYITGVSGALVKDCMLGANFCAGTGGAAYLNSSVQMVNCTVADSPDAAGIGLYANSGTCAVTNCIVWNNTLSHNSGTFTLDYCCIEGGQGGYTGANNISGDPIFARGYHLSHVSAGESADSPCINAGSTNASALGLGMRTTRTDGTNDVGTVDIGYHYDQGLPAIGHIYVATNGSDVTGAGSVGNPYRTITKGLTMATEYASVIHVGAGTYTNTTDESFPLSMKSGVELIGAGGSSTGTVIDGQSTYQVMKIQNSFTGTRIEGVVIANGYLDSIGGGSYDYEAGPGIYASVSVLAITNCLFSGSYVDAAPGNGPYASRSGGGMAASDCMLTIDQSVFSSNWVRVYGNAGSPRACGGGLCVGGGRVVLRNCEFRQNRALKISVNGKGRGGGLYIGGGNGHYIQNCLITSNEAHHAGGGIYYSSTSVSIMNCTIADNYGTDADQGIYAYSSTLAFTNTILWNNGDDIAEDSGTITLDYCCVEDGTNGYAGTGSIMDDPFFADTLDDYHLKSAGGRWDPAANAGAGAWAFDYNSSPCIDAGDPATVWTGLEQQPNGNRVNMGAYGNTAQASRTMMAGTMFMFR